MDAGVEDEEKYGKARRQTRQKMLSLLVLFVAAGCVTVLITLQPSNLIDQLLDLSKEVGLREGGSGSEAEAKEEADVADVQTAVPTLPPVDMKALVEQVQELDAEVRRIKETGVIMETDPESLEATHKLQVATRKLLHARYGKDEPYRVHVILEFQEGSPEWDEKGADGSILLEMAPSSLQPHSIFMFMEVARQYKGGGFHRIAGHVLQVLVRGKFPHLAFQEYSSAFPHRKGTVGYAGRPSGPGWYVSIRDNTVNHGPGSQQHHNPYEADSCFGKVIAGFENEVQRIAKIPEQGFLRDKKKHVLIKEMRILVPGAGPDAEDGYVRWKDPEDDD